MTGRAPRRRRPQIQVLLPQALRRFLGALRMALQVQVSLHGRNEAYTLPYLLAQEDPLVVRQDQPDVRAGLRFTETDLLEQRSRRNLLEVERDPAEPGKVAQQPGRPEAGGCIGDLLRFKDGRQL